MFVWIDQMIDQNWSNDLTDQMFDHGALINSTD